MTGCREDRRQQHRVRSPGRSAVDGLPRMRRRRDQPAAAVPGPPMASLPPDQSFRPVNAIRSHCRGEPGIGSNQHPQTETSASGLQANRQLVPRGVLVVTQQHGAPARQMRQGRQRIGQSFRVRHQNQRRKAGIDVGRFEASGEVCYGRQSRTISPSKANRGPPGPW